jgi:hypothetical protein
MHPFLPAAIGAALLLTVPDTGSSLALYGVLISTVAGVVKQYLDRRNDQRDAEQKHRFEMEDRASLARAVAENTALTKTGIEAAATALDAANHTNEKIAALGTTITVNTTK